MQSLSEEEKRQVLGSVLSDQLAAIQDSVKDVPNIKAQLDRLDESIEQFRADLRVVRAAVTDITHQVNDQDRQIADLQAI